MKETEAKGAMRWNELPGLRFGPYEIIKEVGRGGTSRVFQAFDHNQLGEVAVKVIPNDADDRVAFIQRFIRETEIVRKLHHPNIVPIFDAGETDEFVFQAMRLVTGITLRQRAAQGMSPQEAARYMIQAANALHHAHLQGIVHRDVKPSNMLLPDENPELLLLTDFGTAKILGARGPTKTGATIGTPEYMSPEQAEGREVDQRSDIYSLGCTLYEALAGRPPFIGATSVSVLYQHVHAQPTYIRTYNGAVPRELWNVLRICLAKRPEARYGSAERLVEELRPFAEGLIQPTPAPWNAPPTGRLQFDSPDRPTNRPLRSQSTSSFDGGPQATPQVTPLPAPFTPSPSPILPDQYIPPLERGPLSQPSLEPRPPRTTLRLPEETASGPLNGPAPSAAPGARRPVNSSGPLGVGPQPQQGLYDGYGMPGPSSIPPGTMRGPVSGLRQGGASRPLRAPNSGTEWRLGDPPAAYRGQTSGPLQRGASSGPMRAPNSGPYRGAQSGPMRGPNSGYSARVGTASGPRPDTVRRGAPSTRPLRSRPSRGMLAAGLVALLLLGGATALGAAGMGLISGPSVAAHPTATSTVAPTATYSPTATATPAQPTATAAPTAQQLLDRQAAAAFKGLTIAPFTDFACSESNQVTSYSASQPVFVNLCTANKSMPGPVTVVIRSGGAVVQTLIYSRYMASSSAYSQGHTLAPGNYDMLITLTINGKTATARDIPFTVR